MIIGFTGSQIGINTIQFDNLVELLHELKPSEAHHGDCIGADSIFHEVCLELNIPIIIHPPEDTTKRAYCEGATAVNFPRAYLVRNHNIVDASDGLIVIPKTKKEQLRSGTWATYRYAVKQSKTTYVIKP